MTDTWKVKHGLRYTPEYGVWRGIKLRCLVPTHKYWPEYGGRGVVICSRWRDSCAAFVEDMGMRPGPGYEIDRIDPGGNYEPSNCRWVTKKENLASRRVGLRGSDSSLRQTALRIGVPESTIRARLRRGWTMAEATAGQRGP